MSESMRHQSAVSSGRDSIANGHDPVIPAPIRSARQPARTLHKKIGWALVISGMLGPFIYRPGPYGAGLAFRIFIFFPLCLIGVAFFMFGGWVPHSASPEIAEPKPEPLLASQVVPKED